ncbi:MAG: phage tail tape measure protein, partial [Ruminococcus sp.]|nr:phage tail tape measure protein [Ruminococcus sp.]
ADIMVDQMAKTASSTNTSVSELGDAILTIGATAKTIKGGTAELNTALGILANNGIKGAEGGTALRNVILSLQSNKAADSLKQLGVAVYDSEGNMRSMNDILSDLNRSMDGMTSEEKNNIINNIFNKNDLKSINSLLANTGGKWDDLQQSITDSAGAAQQMADTQLDNLKGQLTLLKSAAEGASIAIGKKLAPAAKEAVSGVRDIIDTFNSDGLGAALSKVGEIVPKLAETIRIKARQILPGVAKSFNNIILSVVQSIGTLLPPIIDTVLPIMVTSFSSLIAQLATYISSALPTILESIMAAFPQIADGIMQNAPIILNALSNIMQQLVSFIVSNAPQFVSAAMKLISGLATGLLDSLPVVIDSALQLVEGLINGIIDTIPLLIDTAMTLIDSLCNGLIQNIPKIIKTAAQLVLKLVDGLLQNLPKILNAASKMLNKLIQGLMQGMPKIMQTANKLIIGLANSLRQNFPKIVKAAINLIEKFVKGLLGNLPKIASCAGELIAGLAKGLVSAIPTLLAAIPQIIDGLAEALVSAIPKLLASVPQIIDGFFSGIADGVASSVYDDLVEQYSKLDEKEQELRDSTDKLIDSYDAFNSSKKNTISNTSGEFQYYDSLWDELQGIVDKNGEINEGYEDRAKFITGALSDALGIEIDTTDGVIQKYAELKQSIEDVMATKKAEVMLNALESDYATAKQEIGKGDALESYIKNQKTLEEQTKELSEAEKEYVTIRSELLRSMGLTEAALTASGDAVMLYGREVALTSPTFDDAKAKVEGLTQQVNEQAEETAKVRDTYLGYISTIENYEGVSSAVISGDTDKINDSLLLLENGFISAKNGTKEVLEEQTRNYKTELENLNQALKDGIPGVTQEQVDQMQELVNRSEEELSKLTPKATEQGKWLAQGLASGVYGSMSDAVSAAKEMASESEKGFKSIDPESTGIWFGQGLASGIYDSMSDVVRAAKEMASAANNEVKNEFGIASPSKVMKKYGGFIDKGLALGIFGGINDVVKSAKNMSSKILSALKTDLDISGVASNLSG